MRKWIWSERGRISRQVLGEEHPDTLTSQNNLAVTLRVQGDLAGARAHQEAVWAARRRVLGEEHPATTSSAWNLFLTLDKMQDKGAGRVFAEGLLPVLKRDPATLSADQRKIQEWVRDRNNRT